MREYAEYAFFMILRGIMRLLPLSAVQLIGGVLGDSVRLSGYRREVTFDNLRHAFPEKTDAELRAIARGAYRNFGTSLLELLWASNKTAETVRSTIRFADETIVPRLLAGGRGLVMVGAHFGPWELLGMTFGLAFNVQTTVVVQEQRNRRINAVIDRDRSRFGNPQVPMARAVREALRTLRDGKAVGLLVDQSGPKESVFVEYFGRPCAAHRGPAIFALKAKAPMVMTLPIRQRDGRYVAIVEEVPMDGLSGTDDASIHELTQRHTTMLENYVRQYPDHWLWMHKRWKHTAFFESAGALSDTHAVDQS